MPADSIINGTVASGPGVPESISSRPLDVFLRSDYLSKSFSAPQRLECYLFNFHFLARHFNPNGLAEIAGPGIALFHQADGPRNCTCWLSTSTDSNQNQGELSLSLKYDNIDIYTVTFSIVPGHVVHLRAAAAIFISRMQSERSSFDDIQGATKYFQDVSPQEALFAVLQGLAKALDIKYIFGVSAKELVGAPAPELPKHEQTYDEFFLSVGAQGPIGGFFYVGPNGLVEILSEALTNRSSGTKAKRKITLGISRASEKNARKRLLKVDDISRNPKTAVKVGRVIAALNSLLWPGDTRWMPKTLAAVAAKLDPPRTDLVISAAHLFSNAGTRVGDKIVATGAEGTLAFGPYLTLRAGRYSVRFALETNAPTAFRVDVVAEQANRTLVQREFRPRRRIKAADVEFETDTDYFDVEFRVFVFPGASMQFSGIEIKKLDRHSIFLEGL